MTRLDPIAWRHQERRLLEQKARLGRVPLEDAREAARILGIDPTSVYRKLRTRGGSSRKRFELSADHLADIALQGSVAGAWRLADDRGEAVRRHTYRRAFDRLPRGVREGLTKGEAAMRQAQLYLRYEAAERNEVWQWDSKKCRVRLADMNRPWVIGGIDDRTRIIVAMTTTTDAPNGELGLLTLVEGTVGITYPDGTWVGGVAQRQRWDLGAEFVGDDMTLSLATLNTTADPVAARSPWLKGKIERFWRTLDDEFLSTLPGYFIDADSPEVTEARHHAADGPLLTLDEFNERLATWIEHYNTRRPHSALGGRTPLEAWKAEVTELIRADDDAIGRALLRTAATATVRSLGIRFEEIDYIHPALLDLVGERVQVGHLRRDRTFIEVMHEGAWVCRAVPADPDDTAVLGALAEAKGRQIKTVRAAMQGAAARRRANGPAGPDADGEAPPTRRSSRSSGTHDYLDYEEDPPSGDGR